MSPSPAARLTIDLDALAHNFHLLKSESHGAEVAPVVKADGYGLGAGAVARRLWREGARRFFVAHLSEGVALREALGPERAAEILVLDGLTPGAGSSLAAAGLTPALSTLPQVSEASALGAASGRPFRVALHVDTGMNRQGLTLAEAEALAQSNDRLRHLDVTLVMSHLGSAPEPDDPRNAEQLERFRRVRALFPEAQASLAASAGIFLGCDYTFDVVRPGVSLYGGGPLEVPHESLRAVATLEAPVIDIRTLKPGDRVGYGAAVQAERPMRVAILGAGYADGVIRAGRKGGYAWAAGRRAPLVIVNMNLAAVDIDDAELQPGQMVELIGPNAKLDDLAAAAGTVAHEVLVRLGPRGRVYRGEA